MGGEEGSEASERVRWHEGSPLLRCLHTNLSQPTSTQPWQQEQLEQRECGGVHLAEHGRPAVTLAVEDEGTARRLLLQRKRERERETRPLI